MNRIVSAKWMAWSVAVALAFVVPVSADDGVKKKGLGDKKPELLGKVTAISADGKTLTVAGILNGEKVKDATVKLTDATKIAGASEKSAAKPMVGQQIVVWLQEGSKDTAVGIRLGGGEEKSAEKKKEGGEKKGLAGRVTAVSADGKQITLELPPKEKGGQPETRTINLGEQTRIVHIVVDNAKKPAVGEMAQIQLAEGSKDTAATITLASKDDGSKKPTKKKPTDGSK